MNIKKPITLKTIAEKLGASPSTVSKALRDQSDVSKSMRNRAKKIAAEMGYKPNFLAKSLRQKKTYTIGAVVPEITTSFHSIVIRGFYSKARSLGYDVNLMISDESEENERHCLEYYSSAPVDGILISISQETQNFHLIKQIRHRGIPMVFFDRNIDGIETSSVSADDFDAGYKMAKYLCSINRKNIAYLGPTDFPDVARHRYEGFKKALSECTQERKTHIIPCRIDDVDGYNVFKHELEKGYMPDLVLGATDLVALGAGRAILQRELSIPKNIALAGFGNLVETALLGEPITTMDHRPFEMGQKAVELLIHEIENKNTPHKPRHILLKTKLIVRSSTATL
jgi:LacI family transcriptional regulator